MQLSIGLVVVLLGLLASQALAKTHHLKFIIQETSYTRHCHTKSILTVNGQFPGPTIRARKGDTVIVKAVNQGDYNITLHWHGVDQPRNPWSDGPEYITQCPIQPGTSFTYKITFTIEEGTVWWHAHSDWARDTVHGAIIIKPKSGTTYPFPAPYNEIPIIISEWWNGNVSQVLEDSLRTGGDPNISDAYTINGQPGHLYRCSEKDMFTAKVKYGKTYLLRVINAAINNEHFFGVAGHKLTVVGTDGHYTKPFTTDYIMITPGQTMDLLLHANATNNRYYMAATPYSGARNFKFNNSTTTAILEYMNNFATTDEPPMPTLPAYNDTDADTSFAKRLRSLRPKDVPQTVDERIIITVSINNLHCPNNSCMERNGTRLSASLNNISFAAPSISVLQAYYNNISGVYGTDFPNRPPYLFNYTGDGLPRDLRFTRKDTQVTVLEYNTSVEVVFQGTSLIAAENHPMHLHGYAFYVVGRGSGNFNESKHPSWYNLVDPPRENTVGLPKNGWTAIRFIANNPGVWFSHCHLDRHSTWGMETVFIVKDGKTRNAKMLPPPHYMPPC